ncbi:hypothetical protein NA57DRAFT_32792 [Rhizodiscina lignyota]|uniref:Uncharacterized protein n=1 Tax=Rhizodiscina lignyota TaxID=1504668 RepID=A0A9P4M9X8_9PEZI|nr:hypothetical protein NA57DRAFT_32792 [Rhizodiscina lignyota]
MTAALREWEQHMKRGRQHVEHAELEDALKSYNTALHICESVTDFPNATHCRRLVLNGLGRTIRRLGKYAQAVDLLNEGLAGLDLCPDLVEMSLELAEIYLYQNQIEDAKYLLEKSCETAKHLQYEEGLCRAIGNLGKVNYELSQRNHDPKLLEEGIQQLLERIQYARNIRQTNEATRPDPAAEERYLEMIRLESTGMSRLSRCYSVRGDKEKALLTASDALKLIAGSPNIHSAAMSHLFYGLALQRNGQAEEALKHFNPAISCTPALALCHEPSKEHREYLKELVDAGADMDRLDKNGYSALDYAVFSGDVDFEKLVLDGMHRNAERRINELYNEAKLRKLLRVLFQEKVRPLLQRSRDGNTLQNVRRMYADELAGNDEKNPNLDGLKFVRYFDFKSLGRLPTYSDDLTNPWTPKPVDIGVESGDVADFLIFFSYKWMNREGLGTGQSPDDDSNTQYFRMVNAVENFLQRHPDIQEERLGIWVDFACINQRNPAPGVSALPIIVAQCDAVISLVDAEYYDRAWCCVEVLIIQALKRSYSRHYYWFEYVEAQGYSEEKAVGVLREGRGDLAIGVAGKHLTFEEDRRKVLFLERQSKLLG